MPRRLSLLSVVSLTVLTACSHHRVAIVSPPVAPMVVMVDAPPAPSPVRRSPINSNLSAAATVWHLRAALNVAALACRGTDEAAIIAGYNALLKTQKVALSSAQAGLSAEFKAGGGDWQDRYDDSMTRLYNFFSQAPARERFCAVAATVLVDGATVSPDGLASFAADRLPQLDAPFAALLAPSVPAPVMARGPAPMRPAIALAALAPTGEARANASRPTEPAPSRTSRPALSTSLPAN